MARKPITQCQAGSRTLDAAERALASSNKWVVERAPADRIVRRPDGASGIPSATAMKEYTAVVEKCPDTGLYVGYVPGFPGAHTQAETLDELNENLREVLEMLLEDGEPELDGEFVGTQRVKIA